MCQRMEGWLWFGFTFQIHSLFWLRGSIDPESITLSWNLEQKWKRQEGGCAELIRTFLLLFPFMATKKQQKHFVWLSAVLWEYCATLCLSSVWNLTPMSALLLTEMHHLPAWTICQALTHTRTHTDMHTNVHMQADNRRLAFVTQEVCSLSPDLTTNQVDNYANRLYFSHVASSFFLSSAAKGCVSSSLCVYVCSLLRHKTVLTVSSKPNLVCLHNFEAAVIQ